VTTKGLAVPVVVLLVAPEAAHVAVKLAAVPPLVDAVNATEICAGPAVTEVTVGTPGSLTVLLVPPPQALNTIILSADNVRRIIFFIFRQIFKKRQAQTFMGLKTARKYRLSRMTTVFYLQE
jgi:hypothetical protein